MRSPLFLCALTALAAALIPSVAAGAPLFHITDVGQPNNPEAVNESSQVLVRANFADARNHVWQNGSTKDVSTNPDQVYDFNDKGKITGYTFDSVNLISTPVYWPRAGKSPRALPSYVLSGLDRATGINSAGQIAGWLVHDDANHSPGPVYWNKTGALVDLTPLVEAHCYLFPNNPKINDKGVVAVSSCDHGYRIDVASMTAAQLQGFDTGGEFGCNTCSQAYGINDSNSVVGTSHALFTRKDHSTGVRYQATLWSAKGKAKNLGVLHIAGYPDVHSYAVAINSNDWVVGWTGDTASHAFLWTPNDKITDLNELIDPSDPKFGVVTLMTATAINNKGEIVGIMFDSTLNALRMYILTPLP